MIRARRRRKTSPRSASSASRHSTSRRMAPPPEKVSVTCRPGGSRSANSTARRLSSRALVGLIETAALAGVDALETQCGPAPPVIGRIAVLEAAASTAFIQSKRLSAITNRCSLRPPENIGDSDEGVLYMGRNDFDVVLVKRDEFEFLHGSFPRWRRLSDRKVRKKPGGCKGQEAHLEFRHAVGVATVARAQVPTDCDSPHQLDLLTFWRDAVSEQGVGGSRHPLRSRWPARINCRSYQQWPGLAMKVGFASRPIGC